MLEDVRKPPARRRGFMAVAAVVVAGIAGTSLLAVLRQADLPQDLHQELAARVTVLLEQASPEEHHDHGHHFEEDAGQVICAVEPFGVAPEGAQDVTQVEWVYARHMCAITGPGTDWKTSVRVAGPLAVRFGHHAEVRVPPPGPGYRDRVAVWSPGRGYEGALAALDEYAGLYMASLTLEQCKKAKYIASLRKDENNGIVRPTKLGTVAPRKPGLVKPKRGSGRAP